MSKFISMNMEQAFNPMMHFVNCSLSEVFH